MSDDESRVNCQRLLPYSAVLVRQYLEIIRNKSSNKMSKAKVVIKTISLCLLLAGILFAALAFLLPPTSFMLTSPEFTMKKSMLLSLSLMTLCCGLLFPKIVSINGRKFKVSWSLITYVGVGILFVLLAIIPVGIKYWSAFELQRELDTKEKNLKRLVDTDSKEMLLRMLVISEYPHIGSSRISDFEKVSLLREWAARNTDSSNRDGLLDRPSERNTYSRTFSYYRQDAPTIYAAFMADRGGVWCGGAAYALGKLYELFGYNAFSVGIGVPGTSAQHTYTLVQINDEGRRILSIQDAYLNITYVHPGGKPMDYFELLDLLTQRRHEEVLLTGSASSTRREELRFYDRDLFSKTHRIYTVDRFQKQFENQLTTYYENRGFPKNILFLHLSFLNFHSGSPPEGRNVFLIKLSEHGLFQARSVRSDNSET